MSEETQTHGHYIGGQEVNDGDVIERRDPADRDRVVSQYHDGNAGTMNDAVSAASDAFPRWSQETTRRDRGEAVLKMAFLGYTG